MDGIIKTIEKKQVDEEFSFYSYFVPFTTKKAIFWIVVIGFIVYFNSLFNDFVFDDIGAIVNNPSIHSLSSVFNLILNKSSSFEVSTFYRPIPLIFYTFIYFFAGNNTFLFHFIQLVFHLGNTILIFLIFKKYFRLNLSFVLSLLFLVHPINNETVVYISNLQDVLFLFFGLFSFYFLQGTKLSIKKIIIAGFCVFLSLLSKETGALFLIIDILYLFFRTKLATSYLNLLILFLTGGLYLLLRSTSVIHTAMVPIVPIMQENFGERMLSVPEIIFYYIKMIVFPIDIVSTNTWVIKYITFANFYFPLLFDFISIVLMIILFVYFFRNKKFLGIFFIFWLFLGFVINLQIIPLDATVADRWFYFPFIGLLGIIGVFTQSILKTNKKSNRTLLIYTTIIIVSLFSLRTIIRNSDWQNQYTLLSHDIVLSRDDYQVEFLYGSSLLNANKTDTAYSHIQKSLQLFPESYLAWNSLGVYYQKKGDFESAKQAYAKSISIGNYYGAYENMATLLLANHKFNEGLVFLRKATNKYPTDAYLWGKRTLIEYKFGNYKNALYSAKNYYILDPTEFSYQIYYHLLHKLPLNVIW